MSLNPKLKIINNKSASSQACVIRQVMCVRACACVCVCILKYEFNNLLYVKIWIHILKILPLDYMFYMFWTCIPIFMPIRYYLPFNPYSHIPYIILNYKNLNLNNRLMIWLLIFNHFKILQVWKLHKDNNPIIDLLKFAFN